MALDEALRRYFSSHSSPVQTNQIGQILKDNSEWIQNNLQFNERQKKTASIPIETISVILGHADAKTTRKSYATPSAEMLRNNMKPGTDVEPEYSDAEKEKPLWKDDQELARLCGVR